MFKFRYVKNKLDIKNIGSASSLGRTDCIEKRKNLYSRFDKCLNIVTLKIKVDKSLTTRWHWLWPTNVVKMRKLYRLEFGTRINREDHALWSLWKCSNPTFAISAGILIQCMGARNRVGTWLSYRPVRLHRLAELIPWNRFLGSLKV